MRIISRKAQKGWDLVTLQCAFCHHQQIGSIDHENKHNTESLLQYWQCDSCSKTRA